MSNIFPNEGKAYPFTLSMELLHEKSVFLGTPVYTTELSTFDVKPEKVKNVVIPTTERQ